MSDNPSRDALNERWGTLDQKIQAIRATGSDKPQDKDSPDPEKIIEHFLQDNHPRGADVWLGKILFETIVPFQYDPVTLLGNPNLANAEDPVLIYTNTMQFLKVAMADLTYTSTSIPWTARLDAYGRAGMDGLFHPSSYTAAYYPQIKAAWTICWNQFLDYCMHSDKQSEVSKEIAFAMKSSFVDWAAALAFNAGGLPAMRNVSILGRPAAYSYNKELWLEDLKARN